MLCLRGKSKVISVPKVISLCSEAAETNRPLWYHYRQAYCLSFLQKMLLNEAMFFFVKIWIFAKLLL